MVPRTSHGASVLKSSFSGCGNLAATFSYPRDLFSYLLLRYGDVFDTRYAGASKVVVLNRVGEGTTGSIGTYADKVHVWVD